MIKRSDTRIRGEVFERCKLGAHLASPGFRRRQQPFADALIPARGTHRDLDNMAIDQIPMHRIRRSVEPDIHESHDLASQLGYQCQSTLRVGRMLATTPVTL